jgi:pimeloyl-ACP methyl ester carboxylesterase
MATVQHRFVQTNGIRMHIAEAGSGPVVVLLHGFPELWYSYRHQLSALADAGFHAVAPDQRGYGQTDRPPGIEAYSLFHLVGDVIGLLDALEAHRAVVVGHDWGAPVAWNTALFRPDRVRGVVGLSVPYRPRGQQPPLALYKAALGENFYQLYFQTPGVAEADLERNARESMLTMLYAVSGDNPEIPTLTVDPQVGFLRGVKLPSLLPSWLTETDVDTYASEFERTGFAGGLNWYRNIARNWELTAPWSGAQVTTPALYVVGDRDPVYHFPGGGPQMIENLPRFVPQLRRGVLLEGCGHWTQQERADEVNRLLIDFVNSLRE